MTDNNQNMATTNQSGGMGAEALVQHDGLHLEHSSFFARYGTRFRHLFGASYQRVLPDSPIDTEKLERLGKQLYSVLFWPGPREHGRDEVYAILERLVRHTVEAEGILSRTWLLMVQDFTAYLLKQDDKMLGDVQVLTSLIMEYSNLLYDAYFDVSREVVVVAPQVERDSDEYRALLAGFGGYQQEGDGDSGLKIYSYYRGIAVDSKASVVDLGDEDVTFQVHRYQAVALSHLGFAVVDSPLHGQQFRAYVADVDLKNHTVRFSHFVPYGGPVDRRNHVRVEPEGPMEVEMTHQDCVLRGRLIDLSMVAAAIYMRSEAAADIETGSEVALNVSLPVDNLGHWRTLKLSATVERVAPARGNDHRAQRMVVALLRDPQMEPLLVQYVNHRQSQILTELRRQDDDARF